MQIGLATWRPGPNKSFESWTAGKHIVVVRMVKELDLDATNLATLHLLIKDLNF